MSKLTDRQIYNTLFKAIHEHHLLPDTHLPEDELAKSFNVSRTRIRKVLEQLIHERLVVRLPNRGCFVESLTPKQINDVFAARKIIEAGVIELLKFPLTSDQIDHLNQLCIDENAAIKANDYSRANTLSGDFHIELAKLTNNDTLITMVKQLIARTSLALAVYNKPTTMQCDNGCHHQLVKLFKQDNQQNIKEYMVEHLSELENNLNMQLNQNKTVDFSELISRIS